MDYQTTWTLVFGISFLCGMAVCTAICWQLRRRRQANLQEVYGSLDTIEAVA
jgi:hypothetical protein